MATTFKIPSKVGTDNFNLQDFIDDFNTIKTNLDGLIAGTLTVDKGIVKAKLEQSVQDTLNVVPTNTTLIGQAMPSGAVLPFAMNTTPAGWLKCNGQLVSRTLYAPLFSAIGTTYGAGDGSTTFKLPDLRGEFVRGFDDGRAVDNGRLIGTSQADQIITHQHGMRTVTSGWSASSNGLESAIGSGDGTYYNSGVTRYPATNNTINVANGTETRPRNVALLYCIKC